MVPRRFCSYVAVVRAVAVAFTASQCFRMGFCLTNSRSSSSSAPIVTASAATSSKLFGTNANRDKTSNYGRRVGSTAAHTLSPSTKAATTTASRLAARQYRGGGGYSDDSGNESGDIARQRSRATDRPTQTAFDQIPGRVAPNKPKILVLGASGKIGRLVVQQLLDSTKSDMTVVALVRNYDKAIKVLYEDEMVLARKKGPTLQIVQCDLVPPEELPGWDPLKDPASQEEELVWLAKAESAASFRGDSVEDYDNRELLPDVNENLEDAIRDCTAIISCVGSVRYTNIWTDLLARPFLRLLRPDVSVWCKDGSHPYYVNFASTRKAVGYAEREQLRREAAAAAVAEEMEVDVETIHVPKIRFVRISDLVVGHNPWQLVPVIVNAFHSMTLRYQEMAEKLLESSPLLETVVIRPGDLVDDERDVKTTALQVSCTGLVPSPARVGREDVAALAVSAALFPSRNDTQLLDGSSITSSGSAPFHYTLGVRWVGDDMDPYPSQGRLSDGLEDASKCMKRAINQMERSKKQQQQRRKMLVDKQKNMAKPGSLSFPGTQQRQLSDTVLRMANQMTRTTRQASRGLKPYGICVAVPVYLFLSLVFKAVCRPILPYVPGGETILVPAIHQMNRLLSVTMAYIFRELKLVLPFIARRKQYISF